MKKSFLVMLFLCIILCTSCKKEGDFVLRQVNQNCIIYKDAAKMSSQCEEIPHPCLYETAEDYFTDCNVSQYKFINETAYTIVNTKDGLYLISYDSFDNIRYPKSNTSPSFKYSDKIIFSPLRNEEKLNELQLGMSASDAEFADPNGNFDFLYASWSGFPQISTHYFENGDAFWIIYDTNTKTILNIIRFTI